MMKSLTNLKNIHYCSTSQLEMPLPQILALPRWEFPIWSDTLTTWDFLPK